MSEEGGAPASGARVLSKAVVGLGAIATLGVALWKVRPWEAPVDVIPQALLLVLWVVSPYLPLAVSEGVSRGRAGSWVTLGGAGLATLLGLVVYVDAFFLQRENPLLAFLFLSVPIVQWGIAGLSLGVVLILRARARANRRIEAPGEESREPEV